MDNTFTDNIKIILENNFKVDSTNIFKNSELIQYINYKTKSANKGSKSRSSFANLYAIYVLVEDYISKNIILKGNILNIKERFTTTYSQGKESYLLATNFRTML
jgi:hypothetical protein